MAALEKASLAEDEKLHHEEVTGGRAKEDTESTSDVNDEGDETEDVGGLVASHWSSKESTPAASSSKEGSLLYIPCCNVLLDNNIPYTMTFSLHQGGVVMSSQVKHTHTVIKIHPLAHILDN